MSYRLQLQGLRAEKRLKLKGLAVLADALVADIHVAANPHIPVQRVDAEGILARAQDLKKNVDQIRKLTAEIMEIEEELGVEKEDG